MANLYEPAPARILAVRRETYDVSTYTLAFTDGSRQAAYRFVPGQFNMLTIFGVGEAPISLSSDAEDTTTFQHTVYHVGRVTKVMQSLKVDDLLWVRGPYGNGWPLTRLEGRNVLLVGYGIGLAPLRPVIMHATRHRERYGQVELLYAAPTPADLLFAKELPWWQTAGIKVRLSVDALPGGGNWPHRLGGLLPLLEDTNVRAAETVVLASGPEGILQAATSWLMTRGFLPERIYLCLERRMNCGIGKCGKCQIGPKFVCRDGPIFSYAELSAIPELALPQPPDRR